MEAVKALDGDFCLLPHTFKVKTMAVCHPAQEHFSFPLPYVLPGRARFFLHLPNDTGAKDTDFLWPNFPAANEQVGTVDHLSGDTQIAVDSRSNGSLITQL